MHPETRLIRQRLPQTPEREHSQPLFLTSSFTFEDAAHGAALFEGHAAGNLYSRFSNPNTDEFAQRLADLEGASAGVSTASGMAAVFATCAALLGPGDHVIAARELFGNTAWVVDEWLPKQGVEVTRVPVADTDAYLRAAQPNTRMVLLETPANPTLTLADLEPLGVWAKDEGILLVVDNCFASPAVQQPVQWGAHLVLHSATKWIDGQGRVLGGAIVGDADPVARIGEFLRRTGGCLSPFNAWVLSRSLETLHVRMERHAASAARIADFLHDHKQVTRIFYPHHHSFAQADLGRKYLRTGGGLVGFEVLGGARRGAAVLDALELHSLTANLGDVRSIATHPASTTHSRLTEAQRLAAGIAPGFLRLSVGLEHADDLIADLDHALNSTA